MRFNNPPGWPIPPTGWRPPPGWQPDPSWPPAPDGWPLWIPDQERPNPPRRAWILAGLGVVFTVALVGALLIYFTGGSSRNVGASDKSDIDNLNQSMIVTTPPTSEFESRWEVDTYHDVEPDSHDYSPEVCESLLLGFPAEIQVVGRYEDGGSDGTSSLSFSVYLEQTDDRPNLHERISECARYTVDNRIGGLFEGEITGVVAPGLPEWASAASNGEPGNEIGRSVLIVGFYRGIYVRIYSSRDGAALSDNHIDSAVALFNAQIARLEAM